MTREQAARLIAKGVGAQVTDGRPDTMLTISLGVWWANDTDNGDLQDRLLHLAIDQKIALAEAVEALRKAVASMEACQSAQFGCLPELKAAIQKGEL